MEIRQRAIRLVAYTFIFFIALPFKLKGDFPQYSGSSPFSFAPVEAPYEFQFFTCDVDLDGDMDFVFRSATSLYVYYYNQISGQIEYLWNVSITSPLYQVKYNRGVKHGAVDVDGDGEIEVVALDNNNVIWWYDGKTGAFEDSIHVENYLLNSNQRVAHIVIVNLRGAGDRDVIVQTNDLTDSDHADCTYYINRTLIAFNMETKEKLWQVNQDADFLISANKSLYEGYWGQAHGPLVCADVDGDGMDEVVGGNMIDNDGTEIDGVEPIRDPRMGEEDHWWVGYNTSSGFVDHLDACVVGDFRPDHFGLEWAVCSEDWLGSMDQWNTVMLGYTPGNTDIDTMYSDITTLFIGSYREPQDITIGNFSNSYPYCETWNSSRIYPADYGGLPQTPWIYDYDGGPHVATYEMDDALPENFNSHPTDGNGRGLEQIWTIDWDGGTTEYICGTAKHVFGQTGIFNAMDCDDIWTTLTAYPSLRTGFVYVADVQGDSREEIIVWDSADNKVKIFWNTATNSNSKPAKWDDPLYRRLKQNWNYYSPGSYTQRTPARLQLKVFLEGPYNTGSDQMNTDLAAYIPTVSPYLEDLRVINPIPSGVVDWVLIQLRSVEDGNAVISRSALLSADGDVVADDGVTEEIDLFVESASYFIVVKHRNHLSIMSKLSQPFTQGSQTGYDFTGSDDQYYGSGGTKQLESGVWGMYAGNAENTNDMINVPDYSEVKSKFANTGYYNADINLSGVVSIPDYSLTKSNFAKTSKVP